MTRHVSTVSYLKYSIGYESCTNRLLVLVDGASHPEILVLCDEAA